MGVISNDFFSKLNYHTYAIKHKPKKNSKTNLSFGLNYSKDIVFHLGEEVFQVLCHS